MARIQEQLRQDHPWWFGKAAAGDPHLRRLERKRIRWDPPVLTSIPMSFGDTHTLRGPRQAGKTTTIKRMLRRLVEQGETRILYYAFDFGTEPTVIVDVIRAAKRLHPDPKGPWHLFLDEVTSIPDWQLGVKVAWDTGLTSDDAVILTASSAHDLKRGAERLPGRRGKGRDYLQLPMSFRDFCQVAHSVSFDDEPLAAEEFLTERGRGVASRLVSQADTLMRAFDVYVEVGGFPAAVDDWVATGLGADAETVRTVWDIIAGDVSKSGRDQTAALKLMQAVGTSLGSTMSWRGAARAMGFEAPATAKEYVELLAESFVLLAVYYWDIGRRTLEPRKQRKVYWLDPLIGLVPQLLIPGTPAPGLDGVIENVVASGLFRSAAQTIVQATAVPGAVGYWRSSGDREIDFVVPRASDPATRRFPIEQKGDNAAAITGARQAIAQRFGEGLVLSRTVFDWRPQVATIPVWAFLAGLREQPQRRVVVG